MILKYNLLIKRLCNGLGAHSLSQLINLLIRLAEVPLFMTFWNAERYGEWLILAAIPTFFSMADGGFTNATQKEMIINVGRGDHKKALAYFQSTWVLLIIISLFFIGLTTTSIFFLPLDKWLHLESMHDTTIPSVILLLTIHTILGFQSGLFYGAYASEMRYARGVVLISFGQALEFAALGCAVILGGSPVEVAASYLSARVISILILILDLHNIAPWLSIGWANSKKSHILRLARPSIASLAFPLGDSINVQGIRLIVGLILGPTILAVFSSIRTFSRSAMKFTTIIGRTIEPEIANAYGAGKKNLLKKIFNHANRIAILVNLIVCIILWLIGPSLFAIWTGGKISIDSSLFAILLLASAINSQWFIALIVPFATNRHENLALIYAFAQFVSLFFAAIFAYHAGIIGVGIALLMLELVLSIIVIRQTLRLVEENYIELLKNIIQPLHFQFFLNNNILSKISTTSFYMRLINPFKKKI